MQSRSTMDTPKDPTTKRLHGLALYPKEWRGYLVSENKICFQFNKAQAKLRVQDRDYRGLQIDPKTSTYSLPIAAGGTDMEFIAVGVPIDLHPPMLLHLIHSYREHLERYPNHQVNLKDKLTEVYKALGLLLEDIK